MISDFFVAELKKISLAEKVRKKHAELVLKAQDKLANSKKLKVVFLVVHEGIWKYDRLFEALCKSNEFEPLVLVCPYTIDDNAIIHKNIKSTVKFFSDKKYQVISSWSDLGRWIDIEELGPDIVFFTYPHSLTLEKYYSDVFLNYICLYGGYGIKTADYAEGQDQYNQLFHNVMWRTYISTPEDFSVFNRLSAVKRKSVELVGECNIEALCVEKNIYNSNLDNQNRRKKIIWAPHHTITESWFPLATFLNNHDFFKTIAHKTVDTVEWIFKPHPALRAKLYRHPDWGAAKTEEYFGFWAEQVNTRLQEGSYIELFIESDAMILDSATFVGEYQFVDKPMLYLMNEGAYEHFTQLGRNALKACEIAYDTDKIESFVQDVISGVDRNKENRKTFLEQHSYVLGGGYLPSENIMRSLKAGLGMDLYSGTASDDGDDSNVIVTVIVIFNEFEVVRESFFRDLLSQEKVTLDLHFLYIDPEALYKAEELCVQRGIESFNNIRYEADSVVNAVQQALSIADGEYVTFLQGTESIASSCFFEQATYLHEQPGDIAVATSVGGMFVRNGNDEAVSNKVIDSIIYCPHREVLASMLFSLNSLLIRKNVLVQKVVQVFDLEIEHKFICALLLQGNIGKIYRILKCVPVDSIDEMRCLGFPRESAKEYLSAVCSYVEDISLECLTGVDDLSDTDRVEVLLGLSCFLRLLDNYYFNAESLGTFAAEKLVARAQAMVELKQEKLSFLAKPLNGSISIKSLLTDECVKWFGDLLPFVDGFADKKLIKFDREASIVEWVSERKLLDNQKKYLSENLQPAMIDELLVFICISSGEKEGPSLDVVGGSVDQRFNKLETEFSLTKQIVYGEGFIKRINDSIAIIDCEWLVVLHGKGEVIASGLIMAQVELSRNPNLSAISFDEIYRQNDGSLGAAFRPSSTLDYLLSFPAGMSRHWVFNRKALLEIGGFNPNLPDAFELDAILRLISKNGLECIGHIAEPLVITPPPILANVDDERKAIEQHLHERGYPQAQVHAPKPGRYQIRYNHPDKPIVSVILAAGSSLSNLQRCVEGLLGNTSYQNFEILFIDQPSSAVEVKEWLAGLAAMEEPKLRVFSSMQQALSQQYNEVQQHAIGDYLLFLSADTAIISTHWLDEMLNHAQRGEVGVVGAKLLTPGGEIAHAGHILGLEGPVGSPFVGEPMDAPGYMQRLQVDQNLSAVGGDCLLVLRELFVQLDGFANGALADEYLSAGLCLRAREAGFLIVWTPHAQLMLDKPKATRPSAEQEDVMYEKWLPQLARDPAYNPNFSLSMPGGFKLADTQISWRPLDSIRPAPVALVHPADLAGCGHYRVMQPFLAMKGEGMLDGAISTGLMHVTDLERYNPDCIVLQRQIGDARLEAMQRMQKFSRAFKVYELDDYLPNLPLKSVHRKDMPKDILRSLRRGLSFVDRFVVSTHALAEAFSGLHGEIVVRENRLPLSWWGGLQTERRQGKKPRVGWAGGSSHTGDLELITDVVRDLADEVEWVFFGMCPDALKPYVHEFHGGVPIEQYPAKLASLNLDLGLAPLEHNLFNECKSNLRQLEYGACGIPIICTDIRPYQDGLNAGLPVTLVKNRYKDWVEAIRMHVNDLDATAKMADELQAKVKADWMLQGEHLERWRDAWLGK